MNRMTARDHRAVVMRCTATNVTPAVEKAAKNNQLKWKAVHRRSGFMNNPTTNVTAPRTASVRHSVRTRAGIGRLDAARTSAGEKTRGGGKHPGGGPGGL